MIILVNNNIQAQIKRCYMGEMNKKKSLNVYSDPIPLNKENLYKEDSQNYIIPVVFHVIYGSKADNIYKLPDFYYKNQIVALNEGFGRYGNSFNNSDLGADAKIKFCLAVRDPDGNPSTGINRLQNNYYTNIKDRNGSDDENLKLLINWDLKRYLNVWVVNQIDGADNIAGYSFLPRNSVKYNNGSPTPSDYDGIVINYRFIGKNNPFGYAAYNQGKTLVHETGHYLNLMHPWGGDDKAAGQGGCDDDDGIDDTPDCEYVYQSSDCIKPFQCGFYRQIENHMDYSVEQCANLFTVGQINKMRTAIRYYRPYLVSCENLKSIAGCLSENCTRKTTSIADDVKLYPNPSNGNLTAYFWLADYQKVTFTFYDCLGRLMNSIDNIYATSGSTSIDIQDLPNGLYMVAIKTNSKTIYQKILVEK